MNNKKLIPVSRKDSVTQRLYKSIEIINGCWVWKKCLRNGYGAWTINGKNHYAHRVSYELFKGKIKEGLHLDHLCRNEPCVNPFHLEAVTPTENLFRSNMKSIILMRKGECAKGHKVEGDNLIHVKKSNKKRCRKCFNEIGRRYHKRKRDRQEIEKGIKYE